jgi:hypothetical protein
MDADEITLEIPVDPSTGEERYELYDLATGKQLQAFNPTMVVPLAWVTEAASELAPAPTRARRRLVKAVVDEVTQPEGVTQFDHKLGSLRLTYSDGSRVTINPPCCDTGGPIAKGTVAGFEGPTVSPDGASAGWLEADWACAQSYPCDTNLVWWRGGKIR